MPPTPSTKQQGPSPDQLAQQAMMASHGVAMKAAAAHGAALDKLHQGIQSQSAPSDREQHLLGLIASMQPPGGGGPGGDSEAGGEQDADEQAVWNEFPSTDPNQAQAMMQQADDPEHGIAALVGQQQADLQKFQQMQAAILDQIVQMLGAPAGPPAGGPPVASPGVGGEGSIGYG